MHLIDRDSYNLSNFSCDNLTRIYPKLTQSVLAILSPSETPENDPLCGVLPLLIRSSKATESINIDGPLLDRLGDESLRKSTRTVSSKRSSQATSADPNSSGIEKEVLVSEKREFGMLVNEFV